MNQTKLSKIKMPFSIKQSSRKTIWHFHWSKKPNYLKSLKQVFGWKPRMVLDFFVKGAHRVWRLYQNNRAATVLAILGPTHSILIQSFHFYLYICYSFYLIFILCFYFFRFLCFGIYMSTHAMNPIPSLWDAWILFYFLNTVLLIPFSVCSYLSSDFITNLD